MHDETTDSATPPPGATAESLARATERAEAEAGFVAPSTASEASTPEAADDAGGAGFAAAAAGETSGSAAAGIGEEEADPIHVATDGGWESDGVFGDEGARTDAADRFDDDPYAQIDTWQDDLIEAEPLPGGVPDEEADAFTAQVAALQRRRLLLIRHAPTPAAEARATAVLRAVVSELLRREPQRRPLSSKYDRPFAPQSLAHTPQWRRDRQRSVIYLFRSDDPDSLGFFNRQIEPVRHLRESLVDNDSYLLVTAAMPETASLREEALLVEEVALWRLREVQPMVPAEAPVILEERFDVVLTACAALFPGLGFGEFANLVDRLAPAAPSEWARLEAPRSRHQRWYAGERDAVRAELHVVLRAPHTLEDVATADASAEAGMYLDTRERRVGMPDWLYERHLSVLDEIAGLLADSYFVAGMSPRQGLGYRRLLLRLDALGVRRIGVDEVMRHLYSGLDDGQLHRRFRRVTELLNEMANIGSTRQFVARCLGEIAKLLYVGETRLVQSLQNFGTLAQLGAQRAAPYAPAFWEKVRMRAECGTILAKLRTSHWDVLHLLLMQNFVEPSSVIGLIVCEVERSNQAHQDWVTAARLKRGQRPMVSYARMIVRDMLRSVLRGSPETWLTYAEAAVKHCRAGGTVGAHSRWLARDFIASLGESCHQLAGGRSPSELYRALLGTLSARERLAALLAQLFEITAVQEGPPRDGDVDAKTSVSIYRWLALGLLHHAAATTEQLIELVSGFSKPWIFALRSPQQRDAVQAAQQQQQGLLAARRRQHGNEAALRRTEESLQSLQILLRSWQHAASARRQARSAAT
ncbi:hypothetical protein [Tahibacter caeni]|uniref:hypothetical protein n=1 Tax=Tahibacter caeni TaxID=1453545 RepID=UPI002148940E|nr:hypothetical protein [Tahibacter caeni]